MDLPALARYPFSPDAMAYVRARGPDLETVLGEPIYKRALERAVERLTQSIELGRVSVRATSAAVDDHSEVVSYAIARVLVSALGDSTMVQMFARGESARLGELMGKADADTALDLGRMLGIPFEEHDNEIALHFTDYVLVGPRDGTGKLVNQRLDSGRVRFLRADLEKSARRMKEVSDVENEEAARGRRHKHPGWQKEQMSRVVPFATLVQLVERALELRISGELPLPIPPEVVAAIVPRLGPVKLALDARRRREMEQYGEVRQELFPPCMVHLLGDLEKGVNVPHLGRFAATAYLASIGMSPDEIMALFAKAKDFRADLTRYQVEHITGKTSGTKYTPPNCATMLTYGLCCQRVKEVECRDHGRDGRCQEAWLKHPLSYYRSKIRAEKKKSDSKTRSRAPAENAQKSVEPDESREP
ncbi:MAG TPA: DNA primase large subunit PriL [Thermoplasmata archaeon]|nr:DNA primase large subunit PriL [Thermoplasmata archaeon]